MNKPSRQSLFFLPLLLAPFLLLGPALLRGQALFWGTPFLQFIPWRWTAWQMLRAGHLPLWNPWVGMGAPLAANYQSALFYPPNWLLFLLAEGWGIGGMAWGQALLVALHLSWAAFGAARLARQLELGRLAQAISGLAFGLSGYLVARSGFLSINAAVAWLPWVLFAVLRLESQPRRSNFFGLAAVLALQLLAGHAQTAWYTLILAGLWAGFLGWRAGLARGFARAWIRLVLAVILAVLLSAVQLFPTLEYLLVSQRSGEVGFDTAMTYSFWPLRFLTLLAPALFGSPAHDGYLGYGNYWEDAVYIGLLPLVMTIRAVLHRDGLRAAGRRPPPVVLFLAAITLISFALALGKNTPMYPWLYRNVPTFDMFQGPTRFSLWAELALALLAGYGVQAWQRPVGRGLYWTRLGTAGAFAVAVGSGLAWAGLGISATFLRAAVLAGLWGLGIGVLSLFAPPSRAFTIPSSYSARWSWAVILFVAADLLVAGWGLNPAASLDLYTKTAQTSPPAISNQGRLYLSSTDEYRLKFDRFFSFETFTPVGDWQDLRASFLPDSFLLDGLTSVNNFDPLVPGRYARWMKALETVEPGRREQLLNFMGVSVVEIVENFTEAGDQPAGDRWAVRFEERPAVRRVRWIPCAIPASGPSDSFAQVFSAGQDLESLAIIEGLRMDHSQTCSKVEQRNLQPVLEPYIHAEEPARLSVRISAPQAGWLVLSDVWYPGWEARVDGQPAQIWRANFLFRAIQVPEGTHEVSFTYHPISFSLGAALSSLTWVAMAAVFLGCQVRAGSLSKEIPVLHPETTA